MKVTDFYINVVKSLGLHEEEGYIYTSDSDDRVLVVDAGMPIVIPTKEHLGSLVDSESNEIIKVPFNPLVEDVLGKGESPSAKKVKLGIKLKLTHSIMAVSKLLLTLASDESKQKKTKHEINKFLASLSEAVSGRNVKQEVDVNSIKNWLKLCEGSYKQDGQEIIKIFSTKAGTIGDDKYNRVITIHSPLLDILSDENTDKNTEINGIQLRPKDIGVFKLMLKFILTELDDDNVLRIGNNDENRPIFIGMMQLYIILATRINKLAKMLTYVDSVDSEEAIIDLHVELEDLKHLNKFNGVAKSIPNAKSLQVLTQEDEPEISLSDINKSNAEQKSTLDTLISRDRPRREDREEPVEESSILDTILGKQPVSRNRDRDNRYSPERVYERAPAYDRGGREESSWRSSRRKPRASERLAEKYDRDSGRGFGRRSESRRSSLDHRPSGYRSRF